MCEKYIRDGKVAGIGSQEEMFKQLFSDERLSVDCLAQKGDEQ